MTTVSIVIPTKNRSEILKRSLACAVNQTLPAIEIIVADNNSTDDTGHVIESFDDPRIIHLRSNEDLPITANWIRGIQASQGEWVKIIYDDDWVEDNFLEKTVAQISDDRVMVHTGGIIHNFEGDIGCCVFPADSSRAAYELLMCDQLQVNPVGALIKRSALDYAIEVMPRLNPICVESGIGPDVILLYAATTKPGTSWVHIPEILAHYEGRQGSLTVKTLRENPEFLFECYGKATDLLKALHDAR